ncbi:MAG: transposase [Desulfamplus sp.]|nr:transposase [Desulfamplus sp.]
MGQTLKETGHTVRYVGRYTKRPVMAESRIESFDGNHVTFSYNDYSDNQVVSTTVSIEEFISRLVRHIPDQHFKNIRHSGIFANCVRTKLIATAVCCQSNSKTKTSSSFLSRAIQKNI